MRIAFLLVMLTFLFSGCASQPSKLERMTATDRPPLAQDLTDADEYEFALGLAKLAVKDGNYPRAETILSHLRHHRPDDLRVYRVLAKMYEKQEKLELAYVDWQKVSSADEHTQGDESELARLALLTKHYVEAEKVYQQWLNDADADNEKSIALNNLGLSAMVQQRYHTAKAYFLKALKTDPLNKKARNNLTILNALMESQSR